MVVYDLFSTYFALSWNVCELSWSVFDLNSNLSIESSSEKEGSGTIVNFDFFSFKIFSISFSYLSPSDTTYLGTVICELIARGAVIGFWFSCFSPGSCPSLSSAYSAGWFSSPS